MNNFLKRILPSNGIYFLAIKVDGYDGLRHYSFSSINEMVNKAIGLDKSNTVYFACASFKADSYTDHSGKVKRRTAENANFAKSFWLDIDCGQDKAEGGKGYNTKKQALSALGAFCLEVGIKMPTIVDSGGGIHAYFILDQAIEKSLWKETANKLKSLTSSLKFLADDSRTSDIASVLRPVGSHNRKAGRDVRVVELKRSSDDLRWDDFKALIDLAYSKYCNPLNNVSTINSVRTNIKESETQLNIERIKSALSYIDPNCDRQLWRNICFAIHALDWTCSKDLALQWSKGDYL